MERKSQRRVERLAEHLNAGLAAGAGPEGLQASPTAAVSGPQAELQALLEHDSHQERVAMKDLMRDPLFTP